MTEEEWFTFVASGIPEIVSVARLPPDLCRKIGSHTSLIRMRHEYALRAAQKHRLRAAHFPMLPIVIDLGRVICDRPGHLTFYFYENVVFGGWLAATIKTIRTGTELWVATFHIASAAMTGTCSFTPSTCSSLTAMI
jgi:hypothetical protein